VLDKLLDIVNDPNRLLMTPEERDRLVAMIKEAKGYGLGTHPTLRAAYLLKSRLQAPYVARLAEHHGARFVVLPSKQWIIEGQVVGSELARARFESREAAAEAYCRGMGIPVPTP